MDDEQRPADRSTDGPGFGQRRRGGRVRNGPAAGGRGPAPRRDFVPSPAPPRAPRPAEPEPESARPARELLEELLVKMGVTGAHVRFYSRAEGDYLEVVGPDLANFIGRHGNTLEALNLIFNNMVNAGVKKDRQYFTIDAEGYRARRADVLKGLALQTLERAIREKRPVSLDPMLPSERKVVHIALADNPFVTTESSGVEPERRVVVIPRSA